MDKFLVKKPKVSEDNSKSSTEIDSVHCKFFFVLNLIIKLLLLMNMN